MMASILNIDFAIKGGMEMEQRDYLVRLGEKAKAAAQVLAQANTESKNAALLRLAAALRGEGTRILNRNAEDVAEARARGLSGAFLKRLELDEKKIDGMARGLEEVAALPDPVGEIVAGWRRPNGLEIKQVRVPFGVIAVIYESRPNVTSDVAGLALKAGNAVILRGGSEALRTNQTLVELFTEALVTAGLPAAAVQLITDPERRLVEELLQLRDYLDLVIPRGGAGLIQMVVEKARVPVIETGVGNCHVYVDEGADLEKAKRIVINAKVSNPAVCNAAETLLVHQAVAEQFLPDVLTELHQLGVEIRGCEKTRALAPGSLAEVIRPATTEDWATEYLDLILAVRVVPDIAAAVDHINCYGTRHSEAIVTESYQRARYFSEAVDAAVVYVNASTRFTDGYEFGFGAEVGISTQKLHARGPMGLKELTTTKYIVLGTGQVR